MKKKITILMLSLLSLAAVGFGQTITQTNTQFPNPGFEKWTDHNCSTAQGTSHVPDNWHTFDEVKYDALNILGSASVAKKTSHFKLTGTSAYNNSGTSIQLALHEAAGIAWANGTMTSGRTRVGSLTVTNYQNYNYSDLSNASSFGNQHFYWPFVGCPDSMSFYYKTNWTSTTNKPLIKTYLHKNAWYDHANDALNNSGSSSTTNLNVDNYVAGCTKEFVTSTSWKRFADKFEYGSYHSNNTDNNYSTLDRPQYILASFSTNKSAGGHETEDDRLSLDELWCIYDKGLKTLTINGTTPSSLLNAFNAAEFATHEPSRTYDSNGNPSFNNSGTSTQYYNTLITFTTPTIATITATPKSKLITEFEVTNPSIFYKTSPQGIVKVTHNDNSTFTYNINFTNVKLAQPTASNASRCGAGQVSLTASVPSGLANPSVPTGYSNYTATCKWYTSASGGTAVATGTSYSPNVTSSTTYYVSTYISYKYTNAMGNQATRTLESDRKAVTVTVSSAPTVSLSSNATQSVCSGQAINNITVSSSNGSLSVTGLPTGINLSGSTISGSSTNVGAYPYTVTCASTGCPSATATGTITVKALPTVSISGTTSFCQGGNTTLTASGTGTSYQWSNGTNAAANTVSAAGNYTVTATLNGCTATASQQVAVNALPNVTLTASPATICVGATSTLTAGGASTYAWNNTLGSGSSKTVTPNSTTTYSITGTDANGCSKTASATVTVNALPTINISGNTTFCQGGNTTLTASGTGTSYQWSNGTNAAANTVSAAGNYTVTATLNGCTATASQQVAVNALPNVTLTASPANICVGATSTLTAGGASTYAWNNTLGSGSSKTVTPNSTTTYSITGTDANGCSKTASATVTVNALPTINISGNTTFCQGGNTTLTASGASSYVWNNGHSTSDYTVNAGGNYSVTGTDANGCTNTAQATVVMNPSYNLTENLSISTTDLPYTWRGHIFDATTPTGLSTFTYNEHSINGCDSTVTLNLTVSDALFKLTVNYLYANGTVASPAHTENVAYNASYSVTSPTISGYAPDQAVVSGTMPDHDVTVNVTYTATNRDLTIHYQYADGTAAAADHVESVQVGANYAVPSPSITGYTPDQASVSGTMGEQNVVVTVTYTIIQYTLTYNVDGTTTDQTYDYNAAVTAIADPVKMGYTFAGWSPEVPATMPAENLTVTAQWTINQYTITYKDGNTQLGQASFNYGADVDAIDDPEKEGYTFTGWNPALPDVMPAENLTVNAQWSINHYSLTIHYIYTDNETAAPDYTAQVDYNGTYSVESPAITGYTAAPDVVSGTMPADDVVETVTYTIIAPEVSNITAPSAICSGNVLSLSAPAVLYAENTGWQISEGNDFTNPTTYTDQTLDASYNGWYLRYVASNTTGTTYSNAVQITVNALPEIPAVTPKNNANCSQMPADGSITFEVVPGLQYSINGGSTYQDNNVFAGLTAGTYATRVKNAAGCESTVGSVTITQPNTPFNATISTTRGISCHGDSTGLIAISASYGTTPYTYQWSNGATTKDLDGIPAGTYTLTATDAMGCTVILSKTFSEPAAALNTTVTNVTDVKCFDGNNGSITLNVTGGTPSYNYYLQNQGNRRVDNPIIDLTAGTYIVKVQDGKSCSTLDTIIVSQPDAALTATITENKSICVGDQSSITVTPAGGTSSYNIAWNNDISSTETQITVSPAETTTYEATITDANGCTTTASHTLTVNELPAVPTLTTTDNTSCAAPNGAITVTSPTGAGYEYSLDGENFQTAASFSSLSAGNYTMTVKNTANNCTNSAAEEIVTVGSNVTASASATTPCVGGTIELTGSSTTEGVTYGWTGPDNFTSNEQNPTIADATAAKAGQYTLTVTETATSCTKSATVNVIVNALPTVMVSGASAICAGDNTTLTATGATTYVWNNQETTESITVDAAGTFEVEGTDANGCKNTASHTITVNALPTVSISGPEAVCANASATLTASGATSYTWSNNAATASTNVTEAGTYTVTGTDANGCKNNASHTLTVNPLPTVSLSSNATQNVCVNGAIDEITVTSANGELSAEGLPAGVTLTGTTISGVPTATGTFNYTIKNTSNTGCGTVTAQGTLMVNELPTVSIIGKAAVCEGENATLTASGAVSYIWNTQATGASITIDYARTFEVEGTDANGCKNTASHTLTVNELPAVPTLTTTDNTSCAAPNGAITVTSPTGAGYEYSLDGENFQTAASFSSLSAGNYTVTVKNTANNCTNSAAEEIVTVGSNVTASASATTPCEGGAIELNGSSTTEGVTYGWTGPDNFTSNEQNPTIADATAAKAGQYTLTVTETATSCTKSATVNVIVNALPTVMVSGASAICAGDNTTLTATGATTYVWNNQETTESITVDAAGTFEVEGTDANGCKNTASHTITVNALPTVSISGPEAVCANASATLTASGATSYTWSNNAATASTTVTEAGTYTVTGTDANGCKNNASHTLTVNPLPTVSLSSNATQNVCVNGAIDEITVTSANGELSAEGLPAGVTLTGTTISGVPTATGTFNYTIKNTSNTGCGTVTAQGTLMVNELPTVSIIGKAAVCEGENATLTASGAVSYIWNTQATGASITIDYARTFEVEGTDANGCKNTASHTLTVNELPAVPTLTTTDNTSCLEPNGKIAVTAPVGGNYAYALNDGDFQTAAAFTGLDAGSYTVTVKNTTTSCTNTNQAAIVTVGSNLGVQGGSEPVCQGSSLQINAYPTIEQGVTYSWTGPNNFTSTNRNVTVNNVTAADAGQYKLVVTETATGCTATLNVTAVVNVPQHESTAETACETYTWTNGNGNTYTESGVYTYSHTDNNGCTQVDTLHLTIDKVTYYTDNQVACESYKWMNGVTYTQSTNTPTYTLTNAAGCDSVITLNLTINKATAGVDIQVACESYKWIDGNTYTESTNTPTYTLMNAAGCDSVVTLNLTINNPVHEAFEIAACNEFEWNGTTYTRSGDYTYSHTDNNGCTQVDTLHLTILNPAIALDAIANESICEGGQVTLTANAQTTGGTPSYTWSTNETTAAVTVAPQTTTTYKVVASVTVSAINANCTAKDSAEVTVTVNELPAVPTLTTTDNTSCLEPNGKIAVTAPAGGNYAYALNDGDFQTAAAFTGLDAGSYTVTVKNTTTSCTNTNQAAIVTVGSNLGVQGGSEPVCQGSSLQINAYPTIEQGVTYSWTGPNNFTSTNRNVTVNNATAADAGQYKLVVTETATGCTATLNVTAVVNVPQHESMTETACETYTWTNGNGNTYTESGVYTYSHTDNNGCTQVDTLHLTINKVTYYTDNQVACESYKWMNGVTYTQSTNTPTYTLTNAAGCDSVITLNLTINKATAGVDIQVACESYKWIDGNTYTESTNTPTYTLMNAAGCDSVVTLNLTINNPVHEAFEIAACNEFEWNGTTYTRSGDYTYSHIDNNGCTQVDTLHLTILNPAVALDDIADESICEGGQVTLTANAQTTGGTPSYTWSTNETTAAVTVAPQTTTTYKVVASVTVSAINANCTAKDSAEVTVTVNELPAVPTLTTTDNTSCLEPNGEITVTAPVGGNYAYALNDGDFQTAAAFTGLDAGSYTVTVKNTTTSCTNTNQAAIVTIGSNLGVQGGSEPVCQGSSLQINAYPTIEQGVTYSWTGPNNFTSTNRNVTVNNATAADAGQYKLVVTETATGCTATLNVTAVVNVPQHESTTETACETYTWNVRSSLASTTSFTYTESGVYTNEHYDANGCVQVDTLHLTINKPTHHSYTAVACDSYVWTADNFGDGATYQQSGTYYNRHDDANGCSQIDTLYLTINTTPTVQVNGNLSIVTGHTATLTASGADSYVWNTAETTAAITTPVLTETTTYTVVGTSNNCSTEPVEVTVVVNDCVPAEADTFAVACESFDWYEHTNITVSCENLTHVFSGAAADGCDSIVTLHLTINNPVHESFTEEACDEYQWEYAQRITGNENAYSYTVGGDYTVAHLDNNGCTQVDTLHLIINKSTRYTDVQVACDSLKWIDGVTYYEMPATYIPTYRMENSVGCDSIVSLSLTILHSTTGDTTAVACETFDWYEHTNITESCDNLTHTFENAVGCDSVVTLHLTINHITTGVDKQVACESFTWIDGNTYTESTNTPTYTLVNAAGCDSIVTLNLIINNPVHRSFTETACDGYLWEYAQRLDPNDYMNNNPYYFTESNDYTFSHLDDNGCTQVDTLHLTINKSTRYTDVQVACDSLKWIDGVTYYEMPATYIPTYRMENSVGCDSIVTLSLTVLHSTTGDTTAVACESFDWYEHTNITESCDNLTHLFTNAAGCDSLVTLHLTINHHNTGDTTAVACETFDWYEHTGITESCDNLTHTFENVHGCDSVVTLHLTINHVTYGTDNQVACNSFTWIDGVTYTESNNSATYTLTNDVGCDSVVTLNLVLTTPNHLSYTAESCDTYTWDAPEGNGLTYTESGTYFYEHAGIADCMQVDTLYLTIKHSTSATDVQVACDEFTWIDGNTYTTSTNTPTFTLTNAAGCDSLVTLDLTVNYHAEKHIYDTICAGTAFVAFGFSEHAPGIYTNTLAGAAANGCDSLVILHLYVDNNCGFTCGDYVFDYEYNSYSTKSFNNLCWMTENLRSTLYADGSTIPMAMVYNGDMNQDETTNLQRYGRLYDWNSAFNGQTTQPIQGVCPDGWRLPTQSEYDQLVTAYGMHSLRSSNYWMRDNGSNASEFDLRPGGFYNDATHRCENMSGAAYFYTADTTGPQNTVHLRAMCGCWELMYGVGSPNNGYSVRCVQDL